MKENHVAMHTLLLLRRKSSQMCILTRGYIYIYTLQSERTRRADKAAHFLSPAQVCLLEPNRVISARLTAALLFNAARKPAEAGPCGFPCPFRQNGSWIALARRRFRGT